MRLCLLFILLFQSALQAYELTVIQGVSKTGFTFVTRNGKKDGLSVGKKATFTSDNVSLIAKAISVTREFTQWEIQNDNTPIPFRKGEVVTMHEATEYLWALTPEKIRQKYVKRELFSPRLSLAAHVSLFRGLSSSVSEAAVVSEQRGGMVFEGMVERELTRHIALAGGARYSREVINLPQASLITTQFLGLIEGRYYFEKIPAFYNARFGFALGLGWGQSQTTSVDLASSGNVLLLPSTKLTLNTPINRQMDFVMESAFESARIEEEFEDGSTQASNVTNFKYGVAIKRYFD
ncbi:MAG: hypothetical protein WEB87_03125 [Bacteriovoracaceae bacterium]